MHNHQLIFRILILFVFSNMCNSVWAQKKDTQRKAHYYTQNFSCATDIVRDKLLLNNPQYAQRAEESNQRYVQDMERLGNQPTMRGGDPILTIPVVVHIVHRTGIAIGVEENLSDADITSIIDQTNDRYAHTSGTTFSNPYSGTNTRIELCLVQRAPDGSFTTGIVRHADNILTENNYDTFNTQNALYWNTNDYMNIYIVHSISSGAAGYSTLDWAHGSTGDGVVIQFDYWWAGLLAHESGHYFNLNHNFNGGCANTNCLTQGDRVCDTPPKATPGGAGTGCAPSNSCSTDSDDPSTNNPFRAIAAGGLGDVTDSNENYMDYSGGCWAAFTVGQKNRMRQSIIGTRATLLAANKCVFAVNDAGISGITAPTPPICTATFAPIVTLQNFGSVALTTVNITASIDGTSVYTYSWTGSIASGSNLPVTLPNLTVTSGSHNIIFTTSNPNSTSDGYTPNDAYIWAMNYGGLVPPFSEDFSTGVPPDSWLRTNPDNGISWSPITSACNGNSAYLNFFSYNAIGQLDYLLSPMYNLDGYSTATLTFDVAYAPYNASYVDELRVEVSTNCGTSFSQVYSKTSPALATVAATTTSFSPTDCSQWRTETINLNTYTGNNIILRFTGVCGYGNNLFLDNINLTGTTTTVGTRFLAKVWLEGAYNASFGTMSTTLNTSGYIPFAQPFNTAPWNYSGTENVTSVPANVSDWVLISLYNGATLAARKAAFLRSDGQIVHTDGTVGALFGTDITAGTSYTAVIQHRNHIAVQSSNTINLPNAAAYDFTVLGNVAGQEQVKQINANTYGLWAGDCNSDGVITYSDGNLYIQQINQSGYRKADINLDGIVNNNDFLFYQPNDKQIGLPFIR